MKKTDIAMIVLIAIASVMIAFFVTRSILGDSATKTVEVDSIDRIETGLAPVDSKNFQ